MEERREYEVTVKVEDGKVAMTNDTLFDDDGRLKREGTLWSASAHIITAVIGSGVLSLSWAVSQLGWIAGPAAILSFSAVTYFTSSLLSDCYRSVDGKKRNYTYMKAVRTNLDGVQVALCGIAQYTNIVGTAIGYTIASGISMAAVQRSNCFHKNGHGHPCNPSNNPYMIAFGVAQLFLSQIPDFDQMWWLSIVAAVMSFTYSTIGLGMGVAKVAEIGHFRGTLMGSLSPSSSLDIQQIWKLFQSTGNIAFAYSFAQILLEIQDTLRSPPAENKTMKRASLIGVSTTTTFYMLCGCMGYAAFGQNAPGNMLTGFGFYNPFWMVDIANVAIVVHLLGGYQVFCQHLFAFVEERASLSTWWPVKTMVEANYSVRLPWRSSSKYTINMLRLVWRSLFVAGTTLVAMLLPFFNDVVGLIGALTFWPLTVYFPITMYIAQYNIKPWSSKWVGMQAVNLLCLIVSVAAASGSLVGVIDSVKSYKPFHTTY